jgi:glycosyltransferase involved in cell wall biosynthesis
MRVLLSAYACEPNRGSEPEVGWQRALHMLAFADEVWVLTRSNNQAVIEADPLSNSDGLHFIYYDLPNWALKLKRYSCFTRAYFILWQWGAYREAAKRHREKPFDRVYHVTFASMQFGSFMGKLGIPFIVGPIAGGERAPFRLRKSLPIRGQVTELVRDLGIVIQRCSPLSRSAFAAADRIYVTTNDSLKLIPKTWRCKASVHLAIAISTLPARNTKRQPQDSPRFVYAGSLIYLKGVHLAIRALAQVIATTPGARLTLIGDGPAERWLRTVAERYGVAHAVEFAGRVPREQLINAFGNYTALVFPSLHDTGGLVVLEALSQGSPVVCLDLGGPGIIVNASCGVVVPTVDGDEHCAVTRIANAMNFLAAMTDGESAQLSQQAIARATQLSWSALTNNLTGSLD